MFSPVQNKTLTRNLLLVGTFFLVISATIGGWAYSLFSKDYSLAAIEGTYDLVPPVIIAETPPPKPVINEQPVMRTMRTQNVLNIMETPRVPPTISTAPTTTRQRPVADFVIGNRDVDMPPVNRVPTTGQVMSVNEETPGTPTESTPMPTPPPPVVKTPTPTPVIPRIVTGGVMNGKALSLPVPAVPATARQIGARGLVVVSVLINEQGSVITATATSGHPLLRGVAERAAKQAKFSATTLSGVPVKVQGTIVYNFSY